MPPPPKHGNDEFWEKLWDLQVDTLEKLRAEVAAIALEVAIVKTKVAIVSGGIGLLGGVFGSILSGAIVYYLKTK